MNYTREQVTIASVPDRKGDDLFVVTGTMIVRTNEAGETTTRGASPAIAVTITAADPDGLGDPEVVFGLYSAEEISRMIESLQAAAEWHRANAVDQNAGRV